jgi:tetratricopeptide (TPR) repeat protein
MGPPDAFLDAIPVRLAPGNRYTTPDTEGNFYFYNLREGNYKLSVDTKTLPEYSVLTTPDSFDISVAAGKQPEPVTFAFEIHEPAKPVRKVLDKPDPPSPQPAPIAPRNPEPTVQPMRNDLPVQPATKAQPLSKETKKPVAPMAAVPPLAVHSPEPRPQIHDRALGQQHYRAGRQMAQQRKYWEAITELSEAIRFQPDFAPSYNARGYAWYELHKYAAAIRDLDQAIRINPKYADALHIRSLAQKALAELTARAQPAGTARVAAPVGAAADAPRAAEQPSTLAEKSPAPIVNTPQAVIHSPHPPLPATAGPAQKHYLAGRQLAQQRRYREAITQLDEAIRVQPDFAPSYNARGYAWFQLHDYAAAIRDLDQAIRLNPEYANAYHIRSLAEKAMADPTGEAGDAPRTEEQPSIQAETVSAPIVDSPPPVIHAPPAPLPPTTGPDLAQKHYLAGRQLSQKRRYQEAITQLNQAIRLQPDSALSYNARGYAWFQLHKYTAAIRDLDQAIRLNPQYANAYHIRSSAKKAVADLTGAAADAERAEELSR